MVLHDLIATFSEDGDNPYPSDDSNNLLNRLRIYKKDHPDEFIFITDWRDNLHSRIQQEQLEDQQPKLFGKEITDTTRLSDIPQLDGVVKRFFLHNKKLQPSKKLLRWAKNIIDLENVEDDDESEEEENEEEEEENEEENEELNSILPESKNLEIPENEISTYNFASNYTITYDALAELCLNQARRSYVSSKARNLEIEKEEVKRRNELCTDIKKYFEHKEIGLAFAEFETKLNKMPIAELEILQKQLEDKFDMLKTKDMLKNILETLQIGYDSIFPEGIPIGKRKRLSLDPGIIKTLSNNLFDTRSTPGLAFRRILDKHHVHLSDEASVAIEVVKVLIKGSHIVNKDVIVEELDDEEEEEEEEELEEEEEESNE